MAGSQYRRPNLSYVVGDISAMVFPAESLDGILDSSVMHHVTSFNNFDVNRVLKTLDNQVAQLKTGGVIIIRDFVIPDGPEQVFLDLPAGNGSDTGGVGGLSTAALFERFAQDWRGSTNPQSPVPFIRTKSPREGFIRYRLRLRTAAEFVLRKDYRADWDTELLEEYTYLSQSQFEEAFRRRGLRIVTSMPIWNPWIVQNRFEGCFYLSDPDEKRLPPPPTNYLIVGEKVRSGDGVEITERRRRTLPSPEFLSLTAHRHRDTGQVFELVERPNLTIDLVPWFEREGQVFVFAKKGFPRPVVNACTDQARLNRSSFSGYITEPISAIVDPAEDPDEAVSRILTERAGFERADIINGGDPFSYYTSPGGVNERVVSRLIEVRPGLTAAVAFPNYTRFKDAGTVRELDATQVLRACHVGGMFDARLEVNIYHLLSGLGMKPGPWIGAPITLAEQAPVFSFTPDESALPPPAHAAFDPCASPAEPDFLSLREGNFAERDHGGRILAEVPFEYVLPQHLSINTLVALPVARTGHGIFVGLEHRDLPAVQSVTGSSKMAAAPAWRLPFAVKHRSELPSFLMKAMRRDFRVSVRRSWELGGSYFPTPGITPEVVYPFAAEVELSDAPESDLRFIHIDEIGTRLGLIQDAHLLIASRRLAHALGRIT